MATFDVIAKYYDNILTNREIDEFYLSIINKEQTSEIKTILDLGCGTGEFLSKIKCDFKMGVDASNEMLRVARLKNPESSFQHDLIQNCELPSLFFDYIVCMYDVLNIITSFGDWAKIFDKVSNSLQQNGKFIFDINTLARQEYLCDISPMVKMFNGNYSFTFVSKAEGAQSDIFKWSNLLFTKSYDDNYKMSEMVNFEHSPCIERIKSELLLHFPYVEIITSANLKGKSVIDKAYFICSKSPVREYSDLD